MGKELTSDIIISPVGRLTWTHIFEKTTFRNIPPEKQKYSAIVLFKKDAPGLREMKQVCKDLIIKRWGSRPGNFLSPFRPVEERFFELGFNSEDNQINFKSSDIPAALFTTKDGHNKYNRITRPTDLYPGCYVRVSHNYYTYENLSVGINAGLKSIQKMKDGTPIELRTGSSPDDDFADLPPEYAALSEDPFENDLDDI